MNPKWLNLLHREEREKNEQIELAHGSIFRVIEDEKGEKWKIEKLKVEENK